MEVKKYVKKPIVVEAIQFDYHHNYHDVMDFLKGSNIDLKVNTDFGGVTTTILERDDQSIPLFPGDFIVKGVDGSIYPVRQDTFWKVYDEYAGEKKVDVVSW